MHPKDNFTKPYEKVRVSFEGGSYSFSRARNAGLIRIRVLFEGESFSRIYGMCYSIVYDLGQSRNYNWNSDPDLAGYL